MEDFFQKPEQGDATSSKSTAPWTKKVQYRRGKTPEAFAEQADPEQVKAGFTFYDKDQKVNFQLTGFTASLVAILSGVSGTVPNGSRYDNYWSSLVADTRDQQLSVFLGSGDNRVIIAKGIYNQFKADLPDGVKYRKFAVVYIHETKECALFEMSAAFENSIKEAIAAETGQNPAKINVFNLFDLSSKFWAVRFSGSFTKRTKDGVGWNGKGDMFFYPHLKAGVVLAEKFPVLSEISEQVTAYIQAGQKWFDGGQKPHTSQADEAAGQAARVEAFATPSELPKATPLPHPDTVLPPANGARFPTQQVAMAEPWGDSAQPHGDDLPF